MFYLLIAVWFIGCMFILSVKATVKRAIEAWRKVEGKKTLSTEITT